MMLRREATRPNGQGAVDAESAAHALRRAWADDPRWLGIRRDHDAADVVRLRGSVHVEHTLARRGAERLWRLLHDEPFVPALGALTGGQAVQMVRAGMPAIYLSGWQVAADGNLAGETYPDLSLYPSNSVPQMVRRINQALVRADLMDGLEGPPSRDWMAPIVADGEAGFGGALNAFELTRQMIDAGAAAVHFEDQLSAAKKCGHMGGKVLVPTRHHIRTLRAARLAADIAGVPTLLIARTDARAAQLLASDADEADAPFLAGGRTREGHFHAKAGLDAAIARGLAYAPYAELLWFETSTPDLDEARAFAAAIHAKFPGHMLAYNLSPSFNWAQNLQPRQIADFQPELARLGYKFQFVTLAGFHAMSSAIFQLARHFVREGMPAYVRIQEQEGALQRSGYRALQHQREVGAAYFDAVGTVIAPGDVSAQALRGSTEAEQFETPAAPRPPGRPSRRGHV